ncbi:MAG: ATP-binding protein [Oscillospiraceae bacterium]|nr:ATP-binding protein [Oscillospiraceae bacterium]MDY6208800.1 ATP-binding protein [Oscillospiraceae bacterium]
MIKREMYMERIRPFIGQNIVKVLTGIRRCGKSVMLTLIQDELKEQGISEERFLSINFESKAVSYVSSVDSTYEHIKTVCEKTGETVYLFLDEIQELCGWEKFVNSCMIDFDCDIYVTGSNAKLLSGELATYLAGRYVKINVYPFSFKEVMMMMPDKSEAEVFQTYMQWGGMPFLYQFPLGDNDKKQYLSDIYDSIMIKDIVSRNKIRDVEQFKRMLMYFIGNIGNVFSASSITKYLKSENRSISNETLYNYIDYCQSACLFHLVSRQELIGKNILQFQEKIYLTDHGIREAVYGNNMRDIGQVLENIVYIELLRRGYTVTVGKNKNLEVDFVAEKAGQKSYYQVTYLLASEETIQREFGAFRGIPDNYPKFVLSLDEFDLSRDGYQHLNIRRFLLSE